ncbi:FAD:protein FMN transferase [Haloferula sargassicola]|uniref:FAD:protein FMN transferase n=1 Tax=Haloferula sargassicola TaxID=490096 RepID=A0ABP9USR3_9BACT
MIAEKHLNEGLFKLRFRAMGSPCLVQFRAASVEQAKQFRRECLGWLKAFEETWSRFRPDSLLSRINRHAGIAAVEITPEQDEILEVCRQTVELSGGIGDPTTLPLTQLWDRAAGKGCEPTAAEIRRTLELVGWRQVEHSPGRVFLPRPGMALDFGGFGKEYAADQVRAIALRLGIRNALIDLGRDIASCGSPAGADFWVVAIENPHTPDRGTFRLRLHGQAVAGSGGSRRFRTIGGVRYSHHIDPRTGRPAESDVVAASCVARDCLTAGIFSRNACILGSRDGLELMRQQPGVEGIIQTAGSFHLTPSFHHHALSL